jgi:hypothetical protein
MSKSSPRRVKTKPRKNSRSKKRASAPQRQKQQRERSIKALVADVHERIFAEAQQILGTALWPIKFFQAIPGGIFALFWLVFDKYRETRQSAEESMWLQMRHLAKAQTTADFNLAVLERLAYDQHGKEKIADLWEEVHAVCAVCQWLSWNNQFLTEAEKAAQEEAKKEAEREAQEAQEGETPAEDEIPQEVLEAGAKGLETGEYESRPHPEGATVFGGEGE